jgi:hypothetical protein
MSNHERHWSLSSEPLRHGVYTNPNPPATSTADRDTLNLIAVRESIPL